MDFIIPTERKPLLSHFVIFSFFLFKISRFYFFFIIFIISGLCILFTSLFLPDK